MDGEVVPLMMSTRRRADDAIRTLSVDTQMHVVVYEKFQREEVLYPSLREL